MSEVETLLGRIDAEFSASEQAIRNFQEEERAAHHAREQRLKIFQRVCHDLRGVWEPRLKSLATRFETEARRFGETVATKPTVTPTQRTIEFVFDSPLAEIDLKFSTTTDFEVQHFILNYDLHILPILMKFEPHARIEFPLEAVDQEAAGRWMDDRIVDFVRTYLALHQNQFYLKGHLVKDPVSQTQFPKFAAADSVEHDGETYYFIGPETRRVFQQLKGLPIS